MSTRDIQISGEAVRTYSDLAREWSGWPEATVKIEAIEDGPSKIAMCDPKTRVITLNPERLLLNPHGVLRIVTPFRLRQEAGLTGALLHESAHARFTDWKPRTPEELAAMEHGDGKPVTMAEFRLAIVLDEPRVETLMALAIQSGDVRRAGDLAWTMRACAALILPPTTISTDPNQAVLDVLGSYILRALRPMSLNVLGLLAPMAVPAWATQQWTFTLQRLMDHFGHAAPYADSNARSVLATAMRAATGTQDVLEAARCILDLLFPDMPDDQRPQSQTAACGDGEGEGDDEGESGDESGGESGEDESEGDDESGGASGDESEDASAAQAALSDIEAEAKSEATDAREAGAGAGAGASVASRPPGYRAPTATERETQREAERFLRDLLDPTQGAKVLLSESPSSQVDGAALSAWRASGGERTPRFFRRTQREIEPAPPVKIAVLVDVSMSMDPLVEPSAVLSWALGSAAHDLRNFAGRGRQISSTLIHWGDNVEVIQPDGQPLPGVHQTECKQYTTALHLAMDEVENQIPGFFDEPASPENRLLVQFTDWGLSRPCIGETLRRLSRASRAGVKMLSVVPPANFMQKRQGLNNLQDAAKFHIPFAPGQSAVVEYEEDSNPGSVWEAATRLLLG